MSKQIFINLPVRDLARSKAFYAALGAVNNPQFTDDTAACMVWSDTIYTMLLTHAKWATFTDKPICDAKSSEVSLAMTLDDRAAVDAMLAAAGRQRRQGGRQPAAGPALHVQPRLRGSRRPCLGTAVLRHVQDAPGLTPQNL